MLYLESCSLGPGYSWG